jgi:hypothetical protein
MQDRGQTILARKSKLLFKKTLLTDPIESGNKMIEPNFANRHQSRVISMVLQRLGQTLQVGFFSAIDEEWMNPKCISTTRHLLRQQPDRLKVTHLNRRDDDPMHAAMLGGSNNRISVQIKFGGIEMTVGINQHASHCDCT